MAESKKSQKRGHISSTSDIDTSLDSTSSPHEKLTKSQRKKKVKTDNKITELNLDMSSSASMEKQLKDINDKLSQVITKNDTSFLKEIIKDTILDLKNSILAPVIKQIETLEASLFEKSLENDNLKKDIVSLKSSVEEKEIKINTLQKSLSLETSKRVKAINKHEQYSRVNNIRIHGLSGDQNDETANQTAEKVLNMINKKLNVNMPYNEIDIAHRLGSFKPGSNRGVIVRFVRRQAKANIMSLKKKLKNSGMSMFDDMSGLNSIILACLKKKQPDEVDQAWFANGKHFVKWKADSRVEKIKYEDYDTWLSLPWPKD